MSKKAIGQDKGKSIQVLPGLPNHFVLNELVSKLPWSAFHILSSVSACRRDAIQSGQVDNSRVCSKSVEPLAVVCYDFDDNELDTTGHAIVLYSMRDDSWHKRPEFPFSNKLCRHSFECVCKLYGFFLEPASKNCEVYVLDLVSQNGWKRCSGSPVLRYTFSYGALDGKIYVFTYYDAESLVYDPKEDTWCPIAPRQFYRYGSHHVVTVGDELWMHHGYLEPKEAADDIHLPLVYHPVKDKWDTVQPERCHNCERLFAAKGRPYLMTLLSMYRQEESSKNKPWRRMHSFSFPGNAVDLYVKIVNTHDVDGELFTLFRWYNEGTRHALPRSKGFGTKKEDIELKVVKCTILDEDEWYPSSMCSIEL